MTTNTAKSSSIDSNHGPAGAPKLRFLAVGAGLVAAGIVIALVGVLLYTSLFPTPAPLTQTEIDEIVNQAMASATPSPSQSTLVYQAILPSLVLIQAQSGEVEEEEGVSMGTGLIVNEAGDILTAHHVVADASAIEVHFTDGTRAEAEIIATQPDIDIAVLHPSQPPEVIVPAVLGNPNAVRIGDETYAVGHPLGLAGSMSAGVISGFDRSLPINEGRNLLEGLIQFDAAVNPGNSGGPLLNRNGQVIGIVTALANPSEQNFFIGIGFAVPINAAGGVARAPAR